MKTPAGKEFEFIGCVELRQILGKKAEDEKQLLDLLEEVPLDSVYYHTHEYRGDDGGPEGADVSSPP